MSTQEQKRNKWTHPCDREEALHILKVQARICQEWTKEATLALARLNEDPKNESKRFLYSFLEGRRRSCWMTIDIFAQLALPGSIYVPQGGGNGREAILALVQNLLPGKGKLGPLTLEIEDVIEAVEVAQEMERKE